MGNNLLYGDQIHIEQIRKYLWSGREYGRAAVIVGSGFSRNAERFSLTTRPFPMWNDLGKCSMMHSILIAYNRIVLPSILSRFAAG